MSAKVVLVSQLEKAIRQEALNAVNFHSQDLDTLSCVINALNVVATKTLGAQSWVCSQLDDAYDAACDGNLPRVIEALHYGKSDYIGGRS